MYAITTSARCYIYTINNVSELLCRCVSKNQTYVIRLKIKIIPTFGFANNNSCEFGEMRTLVIELLISATSDRLSLTVAYSHSAGMSHLSFTKKLCSQKCLGSGQPITLRTINRIHHMLTTIHTTYVWDIQASMTMTHRRNNY